MGSKGSVPSALERLDAVSANLEGSLHLPLYLYLEDVIPLHSRSEAAPERFLDSFFLCGNQMAHYTLSVNIDLLCCSPYEILAEYNGYVVLRQGR